MPGLSGIDLAMQLSVDAPECKILLFSGQTCNADLLKIARIQGHDFELLEKPVHPLGILSRVAGLTAEIDSIRRCPCVTGDPAKQAIPDCGRWNRLSISARED